MDEKKLEEKHYVFVPAQVESKLEQKQQLPQLPSLQSIYGRSLYSPDNNPGESPANDAGTYEHNISWATRQNVRDHQEDRRDFDTMPRELLSFLSAEERESILTSTLKDIDSKITADLDGSTFVVTLCDPSEDAKSIDLTTVNTGDSQTCVTTLDQKRAEITCLNPLDNPGPNSPYPQFRVYRNPNNPNDPKTYLYDEKTRSYRASDQVVFDGYCFRLGGDLNLVNTVGDVTCRNYGKLCDPHITRTHLTDRDSKTYVVSVSSDGVTDLEGEQRLIPNQLGNTTIAALDSSNLSAQVLNQIYQQSLQRQGFALDNCTHVAQVFRPDSKDTTPTIMAVYDGHGGSVTAEILQNSYIFLVKTRMYSLALEKQYAAHQISDAEYLDRLTELNNHLIDVAKRVPYSSGRRIIVDMMLNEIIPILSKQAQLLFEHPHEDNVPKVATYLNTLTTEFHIQTQEVILTQALELMLNHRSRGEAPVPRFNDQFITYASNFFVANNHPTRLQALDKFYKPELLSADTLLNQINLFANALNGPTKIAKVAAQHLRKVVNAYHAKPSYDVRAVFETLLVTHAKTRNKKHLALLVELMQPLVKEIKKRPQLYPDYNNEWQQASKKSRGLCAGGVILAIVLLAAAIALSVISGGTLGLILAAAGCGLAGGGSTWIAKNNYKTHRETSFITNFGYPPHHHSTHTKLLERMHFDHRRVKNPDVEMGMDANTLTAEPDEKQKVQIQRRALQQPLLNTEDSPEQSEEFKNRI